VGFPGETEEDFQELLDFVKEMRFERVGVFQYSHEENTSAYEMEDNIAPEIKEDRTNRLMELQREISAELNHEKIGRAMKVLIDRKESGYFVGRSEFDSPEVDNEVLIEAKGNTYLRIGDFANVSIIDSTEYDLFGELLK
jgi:ribosomal protein S12 methylthiotransferase